MRAWLVLIVMAAGCLGPGPHDAEDGDRITATIEATHPSGVPLMRDTFPFVLGDRSVPVAVERELAGMTPGETRTFNVDAIKDVAFQSNDSLVRPRDLSIPLNLSLQAFGQIFVGQAYTPSPGETVTGSIYGVPVAVTAKTVFTTTTDVRLERDDKNLTLFVQESFKAEELQDGKVVTVAQGQGEAESFDVSADPRFQQFLQQPASLFPLEETNRGGYVVYEATTPDRHPVLGLGGWMEMGTNETHLVARIDPVIGLIFPTNQTNLFNLPQAAAYRVMSADEETITFGFSHVPGAFLDAQDVSYKLTLRNVQKAGTGPVDGNHLAGESPVITRRA